jgi:pimeloyl-ACP methyl ester carboxylesterase
VRLGLLGLLAACAHGTQETNVVFTHDSPLSRNAEIARRVLPPVTYHRIEARPMAEQAIDLAGERFDVYVPAGAPPVAGYGVVVFIAPWPDPTRPRVWRAPLDEHHLIFVSAQHSGNGEKLLDRRLPLALLGYANVRARFPIDERRVYVAGFSGGSRVAEIAALAYPDVFRGAILNAGADPIDGRAGMFVPPAELFRMFQHSRLVFITGDLDTDNARQDDVTQRSMRDACVLDVATVLVAGKGHEPLDQRAWGRALDAVEVPRSADEPKLAACNARVAAELAAALAETEAALARGDREGARARIDEIDARYGGLAAPAILALAARL